ncbi:MAG: SURF1 family protein [Alphaproteobacteria bacterium]|nr:MAG: SURF1 family protein [Alphaproteobacteria bacterium]
MKKAVFALLLLAATGLFLSLGLWQLQRLEWKNQLITTTQANLTRPPIPAPSPATPLTTASAYTPVTVTGSYVSGKDTFILASTRHGRGFWVLTPLQTQSFTVLVNRGFVTRAQQASLSTPSGTIVVTGLLRLSESHGTLLQSNNPQQNLWYARDVSAIATHHNLTNIAPYFIDADASAPTPPIGGLTVVHFRNNHLQYALTWFGMALLSLTGLAILLRRHRPLTPE